MPTFNILLAYDITKYGCMEVEADTWEAAVASLTHDSWYDSCHEPGDEGWEQRVVLVEAENGYIEAEDIHYFGPWASTCILWVMTTFPPLTAGGVPSARATLFQATAWTWATGASMRLCTATSWHLRGRRGRLPGNTTVRGKSFGDCGCATKKSFTKRRGL
jgi:hypothetical protein